MMFALLSSRGGLAFVTVSVVIGVFCGRFRRAGDLSFRRVGTCNGKLDMNEFEISFEVLGIALIIQNDDAADGVTCIGPTHGSGDGRKFCSALSKNCLFIIR